MRSRSPCCTRAGIPQTLHDIHRAVMRQTRYVSIKYDMRKGCKALYHVSALASPITRRHPSATPRAKPRCIYDSAGPGQSSVSRHQSQGVERRSKSLGTRLGAAVAGGAAYQYYLAFCASQAAAINELRCRSNPACHLATPQRMAPPHPCPAVDQRCRRCRGRPGALPPSGSAAVAAGKTRGAGAAANCGGGALAADDHYKQCRAPSETLLDPIARILKTTTTARARSPRGGSPTGEQEERVR
jgi:hypothetical protein